MMLGGGQRRVRAGRRPVPEVPRSRGPGFSFPEGRNIAMTEHVPGPSGSGSVVLNVGRDIGALVLHTPADLDGREIEISPDGVPAARRTHSQVRERRAGGNVQYAAVYPGLTAGDYIIWRDGTTPLGVVTINGGHVTSYHWAPRRFRVAGYPAGPPATS